MSAAYGYIRVSDDLQVKSGLGLAAQRRMIVDYCRARALKLTTIFRDPAVSASKSMLAARRGGAALNAALQRGDHVIVAKLDRAFRSTLDFHVTFERWRSAGVYIHLLDIHLDTSTPMGELMAGLIALFAQWEARRIGERIREAKAVARASGHCTNGNPDLGYRLRGKKLVPDVHELAVMRRVYDLRRRRGLYWREIAAELHGVRVGRRKSWNQQAVWRLYHAYLDLRSRR